MANAVGSTPKERLSPERERALVAAAADGDQAARDQAVEIFMPLIGSVARTYRRVPGVDRAELIQEGVAGLLKAIGRFDPELGTPFWAYASWWVRQAMQRLVAEMARPLVLSDRGIRKLTSIRTARAQLASAGAGEPTTQELVAATGLDREQIEGLEAAARRPRGLDEPVGGDEGPCLCETIADPGAEDAYDRVGDDGELALLRALTAGLGDRERAIVYSRFGFGRPVRTLREVAEGLNVSAERVRQIEQSALEKLRAGLEAAQYAH
ncbi:MAG TPA: sigma-70 family RNA polymerase sigma factor [Baekduia sp.]